MKNIEIHHFTSWAALVTQLLCTCVIYAHKSCISQGTVAYKQAVTDEGHLCKITSLKKVPWNASGDMYKYLWINFKAAREMSTAAEDKPQYSTQRQCAVEIKWSTMEWVANSSCHVNLSRVKIKWFIKVEEKRSIPTTSETYMLLIFDVVIILLKKKRKKPSYWLN